MKYCVIIPTYNNEGTLQKVIEDVSQYCQEIIVVDDGSTDETAAILQNINTIHVVQYYPNRGKGFALRKGFERALALGFDYAITLDSDGQHYASDIPKLLEYSHQFPTALIVGCRYLKQENMPAKNSFANQFSNFWFQLQTLQRLPDTQCGYRLYPLHEISKIKLFTKRYEAELELIVRAVWHQIPLYPLSVSVYYAPKGERVSHFRPFKDFLRISLLNTVLTLVAFGYYYPKKLFLLFTRR